MAKKPRTPPPPRRVQGPKQRHTPRPGVDAARKRTILYGIAAAGLIGLAIVLVLVLRNGKDAASGNPAIVAAAMRAAGCTMATSKAAPSAQHTGSLDEPITYSSFPPVSGKHFVQPALWGNYAQEVDPRQAVHNEEHGGIVIWVGPNVGEAARQQITDFYDESPNAMLVTPIENAPKGVTYPKHAAPGAKIFLTAWTVEIKNGSVAKGTNVIATCPRFAEKAFTTFRDEFRGKGPERFPVSALTPGT